jgi:penicillin-binding protein 2
MKKGSVQALLLSVILLLSVASVQLWAATISTRRPQRKSGTVTENPRTARSMSRMTHQRRPVRAGVRATVRTTPGSRRARLVRARVRTYERFYTNSFAEGIAAGDITAGEDPVVRQAAIDALGGMNGTVVAIDPMSGRILAMVNQKLALAAGAEPCSTIKIPVALAALSENLIRKDTKVALTPSFHMTLTEALAHSNNLFFETMGRRLGFEKYSYYAHQFGLGEMAGWNIEGEHLGTFPSQPLADKLGGVGKMCSFGESISMTPLQLGAIVAAVANGGTLYYLQHPTTVDQIVEFQPKVKRHLDIAPLIPELQPGMAAAVSYGTARSLRTNFTEAQVMGKTGTCSNAGTRYGWFASYANTEFGHIVTVIFLQGGRPTFGPKAAELAGHFYRNLYDHSFFASKPVTAQTSGSQVVETSQ